ncbi:MAG: hypothetical protein LIP09_10530 [Bacteroidales bacterium]|nr:hypothetical protein [Bacteroidales bacterium]
MNLNNISLPYPVLGLSDDILPALSSDAISAEINITPRNYEFKVTLKFKNEEIEKQIRWKCAQFACEYECSKTMLRKCIFSESPDFEFSIPRNAVNGRININCFVSVIREIKKYQNKGFNEDYQGFTFDLEPGDILVAFPPVRYDADIKYDKLQAAGSFMQIRKSDLHDDVFFDISGDKIEICMPSLLYELYENPTIKGQAQIIHASLVLNALTYALLNLNNSEDEELLERTWAKTILYRLETEPGYDKNDLDEPSKVPLIAQKLLQNPYMRLFNHLLTNSNVISED